MQCPRFALALAAVVATVSLVGCGGSSVPPSPGLGEAVHYLPAAAVDVTFTDRAAVADRLGVGEVDPTDRDAVGRYLSLMAKSWGSTDLVRYLEPMADAPFNELDVQWAVTATADGMPAYVWKVDGVDFSELAKNLTDAGYDKDDASGLDRYTATISDAGSDELYGDTYPIFMTSVVLDSARDLVMGSGSPDGAGEIARVVTGHDDSLAESPGDLGDLLRRGKDAEYAHLTAGDAACGHQRLSPEQAAQIRGTYPGIGRPTARGLVMTADAATGYLRFDSSDAARSDASARQKALTEGADPATREPFADLGTFHTRTDGSTEIISEEWRDGAVHAPQADLFDGGPTFCVPAA